jgi:hypothetical protein
MGHIEFWGVFVIGNSIKLQKWFWKEKIVAELVHTQANGTGLSQYLLRKHRVPYLNIFHTLTK